MTRHHLNVTEGGGRKRPSQGADREGRGKRKDEGEWGHVEEDRWLQLVLQHLLLKCSRAERFILFYMSESYTFVFLFKSHILFSCQNLTFYTCDYWSSPPWGHMVYLVTPDLGDSSKTHVQRNAAETVAFYTPICLWPRYKLVLLWFQGKPSSWKPGNGGPWKLSNSLSWDYTSDNMPVPLSSHCRMSSSHTSLRRRGSPTYCNHLLPLLS